MSFNFQEDNGANEEEDEDKGGDGEGEEEEEEEDYDFERDESTEEKSRTTSNFVTHIDIARLSAGNDSNPGAPRRHYQPEVPPYSPPPDFYATSPKF
jgi:hypothetical protein